MKTYRDVIEEERRDAVAGMIFILMFQGVVWFVIGLCTGWFVWAN